MGGLQALSARRPVARVAVALVVTALVSGLVLFAVGRIPGQSGSPLGRWVGQSASPTPGVGGPRLSASDGLPATIADPGTKAVEKALAAPSAPPIRLTI